MVIALTRPLLNLKRSAVSAAVICERSSMYDKIARFLSLVLIACQSSEKKGATTISRRPTYGGESVKESGYFT
jgi:hypothetical protein